MEKPDNQVSSNSTASPVVQAGSAREIPLAPITTTPKPGSVNDTYVGIPGDGVVPG